jgi:anion-transporting  ArsA/GET3 family ATPase
MLSVEQAHFAAYSAISRAFLPAVARIPIVAALLDKRLAFVTGKGGVGKTTVAYALGLAAAASGKRTIVCEIAAQERGSRLFDAPALGFEEQQLRENLWAISIEPERTIREYLEVQMPMRSMAAILARSNIFSYLAAATPGLQEMVTMGKVWELSLNRRKSPGAERTYDLVIVDAPATGHGIAFLRTPHDFRDLTRVGPLAHQSGRIAETLADRDKTGVAVVARPEEMAVSEALELELELGSPAEGASFAVDRVIANGVLPDRFSDAEADELERLAAGLGAGSAAADAVHAAGEEHRRVGAQREQLARLEAGTSEEVEELPFLFDPDLRAEQLEHLAEALA